LSINIKENIAFVSLPSGQPMHMFKM